MPVFMVNNMFSSGERVKIIDHTFKDVTGRIHDVREGGVTIIADGEHSKLNTYTYGKNKIIHARIPINCLIKISKTIDKDGNLV